MAHFYFNVQTYHFTKKKSQCAVSHQVSPCLGRYTWMTNGSFFLMTLHLTFYTLHQNGSQVSHLVKEPAKFHCV